MPRRKDTMADEERRARRDVFRTMRPKERRLLHLKEKQAHHARMQEHNPDYPDYKLSRAEERDLADT